MLVQKDRFLANYCVGRSPLKISWPNASIVIRTIMTIVYGKHPESWDQDHSAVLKTTGLASDRHLYLASHIG